jgi:NADPH:quinone reductase-like Zn-dependent oxidoreductase
MLMWRPFNLHDIAFLTELVESGKLSPTIDRLVPFEELPQALSYQDAGLSAGKIVITFDSAR